MSVSGAADQKLPPLVPKGTKAQDVGGVLRQMLTLKGSWVGRSGMLGWPSLKSPSLSCLPL